MRTCFYKTLPLRPHPLLSEGTGPSNAPTPNPPPQGLPSFLAQTASGTWSPKASVGQWLLCLSGNPSGLPAHQG